MGFSFLVFSISILASINAYVNQRPYVQRGEHTSDNPASWCDRVLIACRQDHTNVIQHEYKSFTMVDATGIGKSDHDPIYMDVEVVYSGGPTAAETLVSGGTFAEPAPGEKYEMSVSKLAPRAAAAMTTATIRALVISWNVEEDIDIIDDGVRDKLLSALKPEHDIVFISIQEGGVTDFARGVRAKFAPKLEGTREAPGEFVWRDAASTSLVTKRKVFGLLWWRKESGIRFLDKSPSWDIEDIQSMASIGFTIATTKAILYTPTITKGRSGIKVQFAALHLPFTSKTVEDPDPAKMSASAVEDPKYTKKLQDRLDALQNLLNKADSFGGTLISLGDANFRSKEERAPGRYGEYRYDGGNDELMEWVREKEGMAALSASASVVSVPRVFEPEGPGGFGPAFQPTCKLKKSSSDPDKLDPKKYEKYMTKAEQEAMEHAAIAQAAALETSFTGMGRGRRVDRARAQDFNRYYGESYYDASNVVDELDGYIYDLAVNELQIDSRLKRLQRERQNILRNKRKRKQNLVHKKRKSKYIN
eukprot:315043_1